MDGYARACANLDGAGEGRDPLGVEVVLGGAARDVGLVPLALRVREVVACGGGVRSPASGEGGSRPSMGGHALIATGMLFLSLFLWILVACLHPALRIYALNILRSADQ